VIHPEKGFKKAVDLLGAIKNPTTDGVKLKAKQHRCKTVFESMGLGL